MKATALLVRQHRRICQLAAALEYERHLRAPMLLELVEEVMAHLAVEERVIASSCSHIGEEHRASRARIAAALRELSRAGVNDPRFVERARAARIEVDAHAALVEAKLIPALDRDHAPKALDRLGLQMDAHMAALLSACRAHGVASMESAPAAFEFPAE